MCHTTGTPWDKPRPPGVAACSRSRCAQCGRPGVTGCPRCPPARGGEGGGEAGRCRSPWCRPASQPGGWWAMASGWGSVWRGRARWGSERGTPRTSGAVEAHMRKVATVVVGQAPAPRRRSTGPRCAPCSEALLVTPPPAPLCVCSSCALAGGAWWERCEGKSCRGSPPCPHGSCKHPATREQSDMKIEHTIASGA